MPAAAPVRLVFSRRMDQASVSQRLKINPEVGGSLTWDKNILTFTPQEAWPNGSVISLTLQGGARATSWLSFPMGEVNWTYHTNEATLAYLWPADGKADIYSLSPSTGTIVQYTHNMGVLDFTASTNGLLFIFSASNQQGGADLYEIDRSQIDRAPVNTDPVQLVLECSTAQCRNPAVSGDMHYLAYEYVPPDPGGGKGVSQVRVLDFTTNSTSPVGEEGHETTQPSWSSTGLIAYYDRTNGGYEILDLTTQKRTLLANQTGQPGAWSPDGKYYLAPEITYTQAPPTNERATSHILRYDVVTNTSQDISGSIDVEDAEPIYSPDGSRIVFARKFLDEANWSLGRQLWTMRADGSNVHQLSSEPDYNHYDIAWSRDGLRLAYVRFNQAKLSDPPELWMTNSDGSDPVQLVIEGYSPLWIP